MVQYRIEYLNNDISFDMFVGGILSNAASRSGRAVWVVAPPPVVSERPPRLLRPALDNGSWRELTTHQSWIAAGDRVESGANGGWR